MAEFLGQPRRQRDDEDKSKRASFDDVKAPKPPKHQTRKAEQRDDPLRRFASDFQNGLNSLNDAVGKLSKLPKDSSSKPMPSQTSKDSTTKPAGASPVRERVEREVRRTERTVERLPKDAPVSRKTRVEPPKKAPAAKLPNQPPVLKPKTPDDKTAALIKTSKAKDAGRLPFVPLKTRERAREAVDQIKRPSNKTPDVPKHEPRGADKAEPLQLPKREGVKPIAPPTTPKRKPVEFIAQTPRATHRQIPIKEPQAKKLEKDLPRFRGQGATNGPAIVEHGETATTVNDVTVVRREGSKEASGSELPPNKSTASRSAAFADRRRSSTSLNQPSSAAPTSGNRSIAAGAVARPGARAGGNAQPASTSGNMTLQGELKLTGIPDNGEATAELNARVVALESGDDGRNT